MHFNRALPTKEKPLGDLPRWITVSYEDVNSLPTTKYFSRV